MLYDSGNYQLDHAQTAYAQKDINIKAKEEFEYWVERGNDAL